MPESPSLPDGAIITVLTAEAEVIPGDPTPDSEEGGE